MKKKAFALAFILGLPALACSSSDSSQEGTNLADGGAECTGDIRTCTLGSLSAVQRVDFCDLAFGIVAAGDEYKCESGVNKGRFFRISTKDDCYAKSYPAPCPVTVQQLLDCYTAAKVDACSALDSSTGACAPLLSQTSKCTG